MVINVVRRGVVTDAIETRPQRGYNPVWNEPFLFDMPAYDTKNYLFDFIVMRGRKYTKDCVIGHVMIGPNTTKSGNAHWQDAITPYGAEIAKWHSILPRLQY